MSDVTRRGFFGTLAALAAGAVAAVTAKPQPESFYFVTEDVSREQFARDFPQGNAPMPPLVSFHDGYVLKSHDGVSWEKIGEPIAGLQNSWGPVAPVPRWTL